jgi:hypothetical protein
MKANNRLERTRVARSVSQVIAISQCRKAAAHQRKQRVELRHRMSVRISANTGQGQLSFLQVKLRQFKSAVAHM